jgi:hypothetical protein
VIPDEFGDTPNESAHSGLTPPSWLKCELCARPATPSRRLSTIFLEEMLDGAPGPESVVLMCADCCAILRGQIADAEWRRRTKSR